MSSRISGLIVTAVISMSFLACDNGTYNRNANVNTNANANLAASPSPTAVANTNSNRAPTREETEREKARYQREAKESGRTVGSGASDTWLWVKTRFDLAAADDLRDSTINVDVDNNVVTLSGTVANAAQKTKAEQVAKSVEGVKSVKNMLKVSASGNTNANTNANTHNANAKKANANK